MLDVSMSAIAREPRPCKTWFSFKPDFWLGQSGWLGKSKSEGVVILQIFIDQKCAPALAYWGLAWEIHLTSLSSIQRYRCKKSPGNIWEDGIKALTGLGSQFVTVAEARGASYEYPMFNSTLPEKFLKLYIENDIYKSDPWMELCATKSDPILMDVSKSVRDFAIARLFFDFGFEDVLLIPTGTSSQICGVVLYFTRGSGNWRAASSSRQDEIVEKARALGTMYKPTRSGERIQYDLRVHLTARERETLKWLATGMQTAQIAHQMGVKPITISKNFESIRVKLNASTREQALYLAAINGLIQI